MTNKLADILNFMIKNLSRYEQAVSLIGAKLSYHGIRLLRMSPCNETCPGALYKRRAKNAANCASACSPTDFASAIGSVRVHKII
jgi:hypothetical protein